MNKRYTKFISECPYAGPRQFEVPFVLNNLKDGNTIEIGGNQSLFKWVLIRKGFPFTLIDPMDPSFNNGNNHRLAISVHGDIRKHTTQTLGKFDNVLLISVLEHIGLKAYNMPKDFKYSPFKEQLKAFKHCVSFVKPGGQLICTLPYGAKKEQQNPKFLLRYTLSMLRELQTGLQVIKEKFFILNKPAYLDRWTEVSEKETYNNRANVCFIVKK